MRSTIILLTATLSFYCGFSQMTQGQSVFCNGGRITCNGNFASISVIGEPAVSSFARSSLSGSFGYLNKEDDLTNFQCIHSPNVGIRGVKENDELSMEVFPNPSSGSFKIVITASQPCTADLKWSDVIGRELHSKKVTIEGKTIIEQEEQWVPGVYFLTLWLPDKSSFSKMVVVQ